MQSTLKISILAFLLLLFGGCNDENQKKITYKSSKAISDYTIQYRNEVQEMQTVTVSPESGADVWQYEFTADQGDIVYLSGNYKDINSALLLQILIDGKVYKQGSNDGDTLNYLTVSGVIPYD